MFGLAVQGLGSRAPGLRFRVQGLGLEGDLGFGMGLYEGYVGAL